MSLADILPGNLSPENLVVALAALSALLAAFAIWFGLVERDPMAARAQALKSRRAVLRAAALAPRRRALKAGTVGMNALVQRLQLLRSREAAKAQTSLQRAGWRSKEAVVAFVFAKLALPFAFGVAAVVGFYVLNLLHLSDQMKALACLGSVVAGFYAPEAFVRNAAQKRRHALVKGLPDALDLLVICAEAGLSLDAALDRVSREMAASCVELSDELGLTSVELGFLPDRRAALDNLNKRTDLPEIRGVVNTLMQTERYGTPLAQSLRVLSAEFRNERMMRAEEKAARLPAILTVPMIIFILPPLFIVLIGPAALRTMTALRQLGYMN